MCIHWVAEPDRPFKSLKDVYDNRIDSGINEPE
jgi:hypothetical protein